MGLHVLFISLTVQHYPVVLSFYLKSGRIIIKKYEKVLAVHLMNCQHQNHDQIKSKRVDTLSEGNLSVQLNFFISLLRFDHKCPAYRFIPTNLFIIHCKVVGSCCIIRGKPLMVFVSS